MHCSITDRQRRDDNHLLETFRQTASLFALAASSCAAFAITPDFLVPLSFYLSFQDASKVGGGSGGCSPRRAANLARLCGYLAAADVLSLASVLKTADLATPRGALLVFLRLLVSSLLLANPPPPLPGGGLRGKAMPNPPPHGSGSGGGHDFIASACAKLGANAEALHVRDKLVGESPWIGPQTKWEKRWS